MTADRPERSPRAETARTWFWACFFTLWVVGVILVDWFGLEFLHDGWWLVPQYLLLVVQIIAGGVWGWETYQRRQRRKASSESEG